MLTGGRAVMLLGDGAVMVPCGGRAFTCAMMACAATGQARALACPAFALSLNRRLSSAPRLSAAASRQTINDHKATHPHHEIAPTSYLDPRPERIEHAG
jgi:hypothetical protein